MHVVGYKFGILCGGGILTILSSFCNLNNFSFIVSVVYCVTALYFTIADSQIFTKKAQTTKPGGNEGTEKELHINKLIIIQMVSSPEQIWLLFFVFCYKIGEQGFMSIYPLRLIDQGVEMKHIGMVTGIVGQSFSIVGSSFGGLLISRFRYFSQILKSSFCNHNILLEDNTHNVTVRLFQILGSAVLI